MSGKQKLGAALTGKHQLVYHVELQLGVKTCRLGRDTDKLKPR